MIGLFFLFLCLLWLLIAGLLTRFIFRLLPEKFWRIPVSVLIFATLIPLPLIDEIIGKEEFERLCKENLSIRITPNAKGRTVYFAKTQEYQTGTWLRFTLTPWEFLDAENDQVVVKYVTVQASGGWLSHQFTESKVPLFFGKHYCAPERRPASIEAFKAIGINYVERSTFDKGKNR